MRYIQSGYNPLWPWIIDTWKWGEPIPEWLVDVAKVNFVDGDGNITLATRDLTGGGFEVIQSGSNEILARLNSKEDFIYRDLHITPKLPPEFTTPMPKVISQIPKKVLELLYKPLP